MPDFNIASEQSLGMSHSGEKTAYGEYVVNLTDEEVKALVDLIREKKTGDVEELELENSHPEIYRKLDNAYRAVAYRAEEIERLWEGFNGCYFDYDTDEVMEYCKKNCGFAYHPSEWIVTDKDDEDYDEDALYDDKIDVFNNWLRRYVRNLSEDEAVGFFYNHLNADLELDDVDYDVLIPCAIVKMAKEQ